MEGDGEIWNKSFGVSSASEGLINQVQQLFLMVGITSKKIKFNNSAKNTNDPIIREYWKLDMTGTHNKIKFLELGGFISKRKQSKLESLITENMGSRSRKHIVHSEEINDCMVATVSSVEDTSNDYWDLSVPNVHNYIANGIVSHNSWIGSVIALEAARRKNKVYFASLELRKELTLMRLDCLASGVPYSRYERGQLTPGELKRLKEAREEIMEFGEYLLIDSPSKKNERSVLELYSKAKQWGADLIVGDQLSWVTNGKDFGSVSNFQTLAMAEVINDVASTNREMGMASVWLAQFNREGMKNKKGRGALHNIGLSSQVEQIVDMAFAIGATPEMKRSEVLVMEIMKSRRSDLKSWMLDFQLKEHTSIGIAREYEEATND